MVKANGLDLTLFQFDYDLTFAVFFMNADRTVYGRYGTRSSVAEATKDISIQGLAAAMSAALALHKAYPQNQSQLAGKQAVATKYETPDDYPALRGKYGDALDYPGAVTRSCMHCHEVRDAARQVYRDADQPIPDKLLFPYPHPDVVGLKMDPRQAATITEVASHSAADVAGFQPGDQLLRLAGQPVISIADLQWVLHNAEDSAELAALVERRGQQLKLALTLTDGWRRNTDISWRVSSWPLRRMVTGGMLLEAATEQQRRQANIEDAKMALSVKHVGQYGPHAAAKNAGFQKGDLVVSFHGRDDDLSSSQLLAFAAQNTRPGQHVSVIIIRDGQRRTLSLPMQR